MPPEDSKKIETVVTNISRVYEKAPRTRNAAIVTIYGPDLGRKYELSQERFVVGRSSEVNLTIDQESVSRKHAVFVSSNSGVFVEDLKSTNGTYVNDVIVDRQELKHGDLIKIGRAIFKFLSGNSIEKDYYEEIYRLSTFDGLTNAYNRKHFLDMLDRELSRAQRYNRPLSLLFVDLDNFKNVNESYGHLAGDSVLSQVAKQMRRYLRREDVIGRFAGEEFAIILPESGQEAAENVAARITDLISTYDFRFEGTGIRVTASVGVAVANGAVRTADELIQAADASLTIAQRRSAHRPSTR
ncbi:MAG: hypothetical protein GMKNLPBB_01863 [Myxococcota bacterium]|nr:hypothetical protein [Myxococcota bacterium]